MNPIVILILIVDTVKDQKDSFAVKEEVVKNIRVL
tara:strand:+ start:272 stop:376 length:105 start_codon:yes stop_codon:yes gene_type:complete